MTLDDKLFTAFPRQGHDALDTAAKLAVPVAGLEIEHIGDLATYDFGKLPGVT